MPDINHELSEREREILRLVATGASNKEIALQLYISTNTVKVHLRNIFSKIGVASRTEAAMYAVNTGLVSAPGVVKESAETEINESIPVGGIAAIPLTTRVWIGAGLLFLIAAITTGLVFYISNRSQAQAPSGALQATEAQRWQPVASMAVGRYGLAAVVYEDLIYAIAGTDKNGVSYAVERYDPQMNTWESLAAKPTPVTNVAAGVIAGKIFVPGGILASGQATDALEIYDPGQNTWKKGASLPRKVGSYALAVFEGKLYLFGGWDGAKYLDTVLEYDPGEDVWLVKSPLRVPRALAGAAQAGGKIYLMGGFDGERALDANEIYQPNQDNGIGNPWSEGVKMPEPQYGMGVTNIAEIIYILGGIDQEGAVAQPLAFVAQIGEWRSYEEPSKSAWSQASLVALGTKIYTLGGQIDHSPTEEAWSYQAIFLTVLPIIP